MKRFFLIFSIIFSLVLTGYIPFFMSQTAYAASKDDGAEFHPEFEYLQLPPLTLPIITSYGLTQQVSLVASLELPYGKKEEVEPYEPRLADAYLQDLYGALGTDADLMMANDVINIVAVKKRLLNVTKTVLKEEQFHDVLLQVVHQRER